MPKEPGDTPRRPLTWSATPRTARDARKVAGRGAGAPKDRPADAAEEQAGTIPPPAAWRRLGTLGSSSELGEVLGHLLDPGWESVGPAEIGEAIANAAAQAAVLDYLDWCFGTPDPAGAEATVSVLDSARKSARAAARDPAPAIARLGPDALGIFEAVLSRVTGDHQLATAVVHVHLLLAHWRHRDAADEEEEARKPARAEAKAPPNPNKHFESAQSLLRRRRGERQTRSIAQQRREAGLAAVLNGTLASLWGGRVWFGWTHELEATALARPFAEGQALVELLRLLPSHPFPLHRRFEDERRRWQEAVLPGRYVDFEALLRPRRDRVMRGPEVTTFLQGLVSEGRELEPEDLRQRLAVLAQPAREGVWVYLYFNAGQLAPALLGQAGPSLQVALLACVEDGTCWTRAVAEALLDDLAYHPPSDSGAQDEFAEEAPSGAATDEEGELPGWLAATPEGAGPAEAQIPLAVRSRAAMVVGQRLLDDPELADLLTDTRRYCSRPAIRRWLDTLAPPRTRVVGGQ